MPGLNFGFGTSNTKSNFSGTDDYTKATDFNQTSTPTNAPWVDQLGVTLGGQTQALSGQNPYQYVAGPSTLQTQAGAGAGNLSGTPWNYSGALDLTGGVASANAPRTEAVRAKNYVGDYLNPYLSSVVGATSADLDHSDNIARQQADLQDPGAFGGSGIALTKPALEDALSRARATTLGGLRAQGYDTALSAAQMDANRRQGANDTNAGLADAGANRTLAAAGQLANISDQFGANQRANITTQAGVGDMLQNLQQKYAQAPLDFQSYLTQLFGGLPTGLFHGETQVGTQNETGTETQSGTQTGKTSGFNFGFGGK